jgi:hypothetical protein
MGIREKYEGKIDDQFYKDAEVKIEAEIRERIIKSIESYARGILHSVDDNVSNIELHEILCDLKYINLKTDIFWSRYGADKPIYKKGLVESDEIEAALKERAEAYNKKVIK